MSKIQKFQQNLRLQLAHIALGNQIHPIFYTVLLIFRILQCLSISINFSTLSIFDAILLKWHNQNTSLIVLLTFQLLFLTLLVINFFINLNSEKHKQKNINLIVKKLIYWFILLIRYTLVIPLTSICFQTFILKNNQTHSQNIIYGILNIIIFYGLLYPIAGILFWNKIMLKKRMLSYAYLLNTQSLIYLYLPIMISIKAGSSDIISYLNIIFCICYFLTVYLHPLITFHYRNYSLYGCNFIFSTILVSSFYKIFQIEIHLVGQIFLFILIILIITVMISQYSIKRLSKILTNTKLIANTNSIDYYGQQQCLFYHAMNFQQKKSQLTLFFINNLCFNQQKSQPINAKEQKESKQSQISNAATKKKIQLEHTEIKKKIQSTKSIQIQQNSKILDQAKQVFDVINNSNSNAQVVEDLFLQLCFQYFKQKFDAQKLSKENIGKKQIYRSILHFPKLYIFMAQILMKKQTKITKAYNLIKIQRKLLEQSNTYGFFNKIQVQILLQIIQNNLVQDSKLNKSYNSKAQNFLKFHQNLQKLKQYIAQSLSNSIVFWQQFSHIDPNQQKLLKTIQNNYKLTSKVASQYNYIVNTFQPKSYLMLFQIIYQFNQKLLNDKLTSTISPFYGIIKKINQQLDILKKQGSDLFNKSNKILYTLMDTLGVCIVELQTEKKQIVWGNSYFYKECLENKQIELMQQAPKPTIYDIILTQLRQDHKKYIFQTFQNNYNPNYNHAHTLLFNPNQKRVQKIQLEIQIIPQIKGGLKIILFINKLDEEEKYKQNRQMIMIMNWKLEIVAQSGKFQEEKSHLFFAKESEENINEINCQIQQLISKQQEFNKLIQKIKEQDGLTDKKKKISALLRLQYSDLQFILKRKIVYSSSTKSNETQQFLMQFHIKNVLHPDLYQANVQNPLQNNQLKQHLKFNHFNSEQINFKNASLNSQNLSFNNYVPAKSKKQSTVTFQVLRNKQNSQQVQINQKMQIKSDRIIQINKKIYVITSKKTPKKIFLWRFITFILVFLINLTILSNIIISTNRKDVYYDSTKVVKNYNQLMTNIAQILISLREYNYYASTYSPDDVRIPYYINYLRQEEEQISNSVKQISFNFQDKWNAFQFFSTGQSRVVEQFDYVVIGNYVLSSITYLSRIDPKELSFPFLMSRYDWSKGLSNAQINFLESIYNGLYVCLIQMLTKRLTLVDKVSIDILPIAKQLFIFPTIIGILILIIFSLSSIIIQVKSKNTKEQIFNYLNYVPQKIIKQKIQVLRNYSSKYQQLESIKYNKKQLSKQQALQFFGRTFDQKNNFNINIEETTSRELKDNGERSIKDQMTSRFKNVNLDSYGQQNSSRDQNTASNFVAPQKQRKKTSLQESAYLPVRRLMFPSVSCFWKILFYILICAPFLVYFVGIFIGGMVLNYNIMDLLNVSSQLYNRKTTFQYAYIWTRQTSNYQAAILGQLDWTSIIKNLINQNYAHQRKVQSMIEQLKDSSYLKKYLKNIANQNICNHLQNFSPSNKYNITFTKEQCTSFSQKIFTSGLKPSIVYYLQNSIQILSRTTNAGHMTYQQRINFIQSNQIKNMYVILAYLQQILDLSMDQFQKDLTQSIDSYILTTIVCSSICATAILGIFIIIHYRWKILIKQKKQIKSIVNLISFKTIMENPKLNKKFEQIDCTFYE